MAACLFLCSLGGDTGTLRVPDEYGEFCPWDFVGEEDEVPAEVLIFSANIASSGMQYITGGPFVWKTFRTAG